MPCGKPLFRVEQRHGHRCRRRPRKFAQFSVYFLAHRLDQLSSSDFITRLPLAHLPTHPNTLLQSNPIDLSMLSASNLFSLPSRLTTHRPSLRSNPMHELRVSHRSFRVADSEYWKRRVLVFRNRFFRCSPLFISCQLVPAVG